MCEGRGRKGQEKHHRKQEEQKAHWAQLSLSERLANTHIYPEVPFQSFSEAFVAQSHWTLNYGAYVKGK